MNRFVTGAGGWRRGDTETCHASRDTSSLTQLCLGSCLASLFRFRTATFHKDWSFCFTRQRSTFSHVILRFTVSYLYCILVPKERHSGPFADRSTCPLLQLLLHVERKREILTLHPLRSTVADFLSTLGIIIGWKSSCRLVCRIRKFRMLVPSPIRGG